MDLCGGWAPPQAATELEVDVPEVVVLGEAGQLGEHVDGFGFDLDRAAVWQLKLTGLNQGQGAAGRYVASSEGDERLGLGEEAPVVADEVDDGEGVLLGLLSVAEAASELLEEDDGRLGRPQHQDRVDVGEVHAFVEDVDGADGFELAGPQAVEAAGAGGGRGAAVHCSSGDSVAAEVVRHEVGVRDGAAEHEGAPLLLRRVIAVGCEGLSGARLGADVLGQGVGVEGAASPGDGLVVDAVADAEVAEGHQEAAADAFDEPDPGDEVVVAELEQRGAVHAVGSGGQAEEECRLEVVQQLAVGGGGGVVELVDDDVVEVFWVEAAEVADPGEGLDGGEEEVGVGLLPAAGQHADGAVGEEA